MSDIKDIKSNKIRNYLRGALSNENSGVRIRTLNKARNETSKTDYLAFANVFVNNDLDKDIYGNGFPKQTTELYLLWKGVTPTSFELECEIQKSRLLKHDIKLIESVNEYIILNKLLVSGDIERATKQAAAILDVHGYSVSLIRKIIYLHSHVEKSLDKKEQKEVGKELKTLLDKIFLPNQKTYLSTLASYLIDIFDPSAEIFEIIKTQEKHHSKLLANVASTDNQIGLIQKVRFPCFETCLKNSRNLYLTSCCSLIDVFLISVR